MKEENIPYCAACVLVSEIDKMVKNPEDPMYLKIRDEMLYRMRRAEVRNPFGAGAPAKYDEDMEERVNSLKK